jgi:hypothetical protein
LLIKEHALGCRARRNAWTSPENANSVRADGLTFEGFITGKAFDSNSIIAELNERDTKIVSLSIHDALRLWPKPNGFPIAITKSPTSICRGHPTTVRPRSRASATNHSPQRYGTTTIMDRNRKSVSPPTQVTTISY